MNSPWQSKNQGKDCLAKSAGCPRKAYVKGYCRRCYDKVARGEEPMTGRMKGNRGTRVISPTGYVQVYLPGHPMAGKSCYVSEHRLVMSEMIGRDLLPEETVHHKNGDRADNRPENLELWSKSQPYGQRVEDKIKWAKEILTLYKNMEEINV